MMVSELARRCTHGVAAQPSARVETASPAGTSFPERWRQQVAGTADAGDSDVRPAKADGETKGGIGTEGEGAAAMQAPVVPVEQGAIQPRPAVQGMEGSPRPKHRPVSALAAHADASDAAKAKTVEGPAASAEQPPTAATQVSSADGSAANCVPGVALPPPVAAGGNGVEKAALPEPKVRLASAKPVVPAPDAVVGSAGLPGAGSEQATVVSAAAAIVDKTAAPAQLPEQRPLTTMAESWPAAHIGPGPHSQTAAPVVHAGTVAASGERGLEAPRQGIADFGQFRPEASMVANGAGGLEVGIHSDAHGWVKVKAEIDVQSREVTAVVVAPTAHAAASLGSELPAMQAYLTGEQVGLHSLTVERSTTAQAPDVSGDGVSREGQHGGQQREERPAIEDLPFDPLGAAPASRFAGGYSGLSIGGQLSVLA